jgi:hypothetical protein
MINWIKLSPHSSYSHPVHALRLRLTSLGLAVVALLASCIGAGDEATDAAVNLPALVEVAIPGIDSVGPESPSASLAIASNGTVAFTHGYSADGSLITVVDTSGRIKRFGKFGQGPGELARDMKMAFASDGRLVVSSIAGDRRVIFDSSGRAIATSEPGGGWGAPTRLAADSMDVLRFSEGFTSAVGFGRVHTISGKGRPILRPTAAGDLRLAGTTLPIVGSSVNRIVVGNPANYLLQAYDQEGRLLAEWQVANGPRYLTETELDSMEAYAKRRKREFGPRDRARLALEPQRHFHKVSLDSRNRLWVFRLGPDPTAIDIFADSTRVGTLRVPCSFFFGSATLHGAWMAVSCVDGGSDSGGRLRLFRIVG